MDPGAHTVPNFLRTYNPNLVGGSLGRHLVEVSTYTVFMVIVYTVHLWRFNFLSFTTTNSVRFYCFRHNSAGKH